MFGKKKALNQPLNPSSNNTSERTSQSDNNSNKINDDEQYTYYNESKEKNHFISKKEIYAIPNNYTNIEEMVTVEQGETFEKLYSDIKKKFQKNLEFEKISNLKVTNFSKNGLKLPLTGQINQYLKSRDIILCDILSEEFWMKTKYLFKAKKFKKIIKLEYKIAKRLKFKLVKLILFKAGLNLFYDELRNENINNTFNYVLKKYEVKKMKEKCIKIGEIEDYKYEVEISMDFDIFEKLIHNQLQAKEISKINENYLRFIEYSDLEFNDLMESEKFIPELNTIKDISKEFLTSQYNNSNTTFLFYNPKVTDTFEDFFNISEYNSSSSHGDFDLSGINDINGLNEFSDKPESAKISIEEDDFSSFNNQKLMPISISSGYNKQYIPDCNMIIVSTNFDFSKARNSSLSSLTINLNYNINNSDEDDLDLTIDEDKNNISMQEELKNKENLLNSPAIDEIKRANKSLIFLDDLSENGKLEKKQNKNAPLKNENIFFIDDETSAKKKKKHVVKKERKIFNIKSKKYKGLLKNYNKKNDCNEELYDLFNQKEFIETINKHYPIIFSKSLIENLSVPESRNFQKREEKEVTSYSKYYKLIFICVFISFIYVLALIILMNVDIWKLYFR